MWCAVCGVRVRSGRRARSPHVEEVDARLVRGGVRHEQVFEVAGDPNDGATVDDATCVESGPGFDSLCGVWTDPAFDPSQHAAYYARVLENPSCRWSTYQCNALAPADRPPSCSDPTVARTVQERAWTSPIWYEPTL